MSRRRVTPAYLRAIQDALEKCAQAKAHYRFLKSRSRLERGDDGKDCLYRLFAIEDLEREIRALVPRSRRSEQRRAA
jgi:hypothetical protein